jgi:hypothetical protein
MLLGRWRTMSDSELRDEMHHLASRATSDLRTHEERGDACSELMHATLEAWARVAP